MGSKNREYKVKIRELIFKNKEHWWKIKETNRKEKKERKAVYPKKKTHK